MVHRPAGGAVVWNGAAQSGAVSAFEATPGQDEREMCSVEIHAGEGLLRRPGARTMTGSWDEMVRLRMARLLLVGAGEG